MIKMDWDYFQLPLELRQYQRSRLFFRISSELAQYFTESKKYLLEIKTEKGLVNVEAGFRQYASQTGRLVILTQSNLLSLEKQIYLVKITHKN